MAQPLPSQKPLPEQFETFLLSLEKMAQSYFLSGQLERALQLLQIGTQMIDIPEVAQRDRAKFLLHYGNMLVARAQFQNAPVEEAVLMRASAYVYLSPFCVRCRC